MNSYSKQFIYPSYKYGKSLCTNCNNPGHTYKHCLAPVNSYGIIAFRIKDTSWTLAAGLSTNSGKSHNGIDSLAQNIEFLLIKRKDSLRFVDFVRGKYSITDEIYLKQLLSNMTTSERELLRTTTFDNLWKHVWGATSVRNYKNDYENSKEKFEELIAITEGKPSILHRLLDSTTTVWTEPEWGFPKGRRNPRESDEECAIREFEEETGILRSQFKIIKNIDPLVESFYGDNGVNYCHKYLLAQMHPSVEFSSIDANPHMIREIGDIQWLSIDNALTHIRSENVEKREILLRVSGILRNYCPAFM
jgi:8-oxo-dGTP pyrophosphatase MutT (NUDIX family)